MEFLFLSKGFLIGISIAAPVGPIGVLCIRRTLHYGRLVGFVSGLGAATADGIYGIIAGLGLTTISNFLISQQFFLRLLGGLFLLYLGFSTIRSVPSKTSASAPAKGLIKDYLSVLGLTITNPLTILSFVAIFAGLGIASTKGNYLESMLLVLGVFLGSACWWLFLSIGISSIRKKLDAGRLRIINIFSGIIILGFGITALFSVIH